MERERLEQAAPVRLMSSTRWLTRSETLAIPWPLDNRPMWIIHTELTVQYLFYRNHKKLHIKIRNPIRILYYYYYSCMYPIRQCEINLTIVLIGVFFAPTLASFSSLNGLFSFLQPNFLRFLALLLLNFCIKKILPTTVMKRGIF